MIFLISAFRVATIIGVKHQCWHYFLFLVTISLYSPGGL
jgi:hypothetical protein